MLRSNEQPLMVVIETQDTKARREQIVSSLINSGGQVSMRMSIEWIRIADDVNFMGEKRRKLPWYQ